LLVGAAATYALAGSGPSRTTTTILTSTITATVTVTTSDAYEQVANAYADHLEQLSARNIPAIPSGYESNATVDWTGVTPGMTGNNPGLAGNYSGSASISILMGAFIGRLSNFSLANENQILGVGPNGSVVVNSTFNFRGYDALGGNINGTVIAQDEYERVGGSSWLIARETWNFTQFRGQFPLVSA
jgi:hypothetical protein